MSATVGTDQVDADMAPRARGNQVADSDWLAHGEPLAWPANWAGGLGPYCTCGPDQRGMARSNHGR